MVRQDWEETAEQVGCFPGDYMDPSDELRARVSPTIRETRFELSARWWDGLGLVIRDTLVDKDIWGRNHAEA